MGLPQALVKHLTQSIIVYCWLLGAYGLSSSVLKLMSSYLTNRKQKIKVHGIRFSYRDVRVVVIQGSLRAPLFFLTILSMI